jgi:hypothetical protein
VNYGRRRTLRLGVAEEAAVARMRAALAKSRRVPVEQVDFSEAVRLLLVENEKAARVLAGQPESWTPSQAVDLPAEAWDAITDCRNRLSHSQGSLYNISRKLNFDDGPVTRAEVLAAFEANQEAKASHARLEELLVRFVEGMSDAAGAESGGAGSR